jgi:hypothetical protein
MLAALDGQSGARRHPTDGIAWYVEVNATCVNLHIGRWLATGRVVQRHFQFDTAKTSWSFEAFGEVWWLTRDHDAVLVSLAPPPSAPPPPEVFEPIEFRPAPEMSKAATARAAVIKRQNEARRMERLAQAVFTAAASPEYAGFRVLPFSTGGTPALYKVLHGQEGVLSPSTLVEVHTPKASSFRVQSFGFSPGGDVEICQVLYRLTPSGAELYRPGMPEDAWAFPEVSAEAELRFAEMRPVGSVQLPGHLAWYMLAPNGNPSVRITWYSARRETVHEYVFLHEKHTSWRGRTFRLTPAGMLELLAPPPAL